jgi:tetratricopeptide (TPR) repeat protein
MADVMSGERPGTAGRGQFMPIPQVIALAEQHRDAGRLAEAENLCRQVLQAQPKYPGALHLLGIIAHQAGNVSAAIELVKQAIAANDRVALYHSNLGEMSRLSGRVEEAIAAGRRAIELQANHPPALNNLGIAYYDHGEYEVAEQYYRRALALEPGFAEAHSNLGNALRVQKKHDEAVLCYRRAIELNPGYVEAYNNLGTALKDQKQSAEAEALYRKALELRPNDAATLNNLGLAVMEQERHEEAVGIFTRSSTLDPNNGRTYVFLASALFELDREAEAEVAITRGLTLAPDDPDGHNLAGRILLDRNQPEPACAHFLEAIAKKPDMVDAYNNLGNAYKELGRVPEALDAYYKARQLEPRSTAVFINLVDARRIESESDPDLLAMEELAKEMPSLKEDDQMQLHFSLSKAYADLKRHGEAFEHMLQGCALKRKTIEYPERDTLRLFDRIREVFSADQMRSKASLGDPSTVPIFVLGMPRSGTTLIEQTLASHPRIFGAGELKDFDKVVKSVRGPDGATLPYPEFLPAFHAQHLQQMGMQYLRLLRAHSADAPHITNKMPSSFFYVGLIHLALPNARIIHSVRNPVDTCLSCFSKLFSGEQNFSYELGELGRYYRKYHELMEHWRQVLPPGTMLDVRYEEMVDDFENQARRIIAYCGLEWDEACLQFHKHKRPVKTASAMQVRQPIYKSSVGRWLPYKDQLMLLIKELPIEQPV